MTTQNTNEIEYCYSLSVNYDGTYLGEFCKIEGEDYMFEGEDYLGTNRYELVHNDHGTYLEERSEDGELLDVKCLRP